VQVVSEPCGVETLLDAWPIELTAIQVSSDMRNKVKLWITRLGDHVTRLDQDSSEDMVLLLLARLARNARDIVALFAGVSATGGEVEQVTIAWIRAFFRHCTQKAGLEGEASIDEERLRRFLRIGVSSVDAPKQVLKDLGVTRFSQLSDEVVMAIAVRLKAAAQEQEDELFTGEEIVQNGRLRQGMAVVIIRSSVGGPPHAYLYDHSSIKTWERQNHSDPHTRQSISTRDIIPLIIA